MPWPPEGTGFLGIGPRGPTFGGVPIWPTQPQPPPPPVTLDTSPFPGFGEFGEEEPEYGFAQYLNMFAQTNPMRDWMSRNYQSIYQNYLGNYMQSLSAGGDPQSWSGYLQNYDPAQAYAYASPRERGESPGSFTGRTRTIY